MADVSVDVSGQMETPPELPKNPLFSRLLRLPTEMPDPKEWIQQQRQNVRPWLVFVQTSNFKAPASIPRLSKRIMRNIEYFQANYLYVFLGLIVYCLTKVTEECIYTTEHSSSVTDTASEAVENEDVQNATPASNSKNAGSKKRITSPLILLAIAGTFYAGYKVNQRHLQKKFVLFGRELTLAQQYGLVSVCSMPVYYWVGAHGAMFWVLGASMVIITLHAAFYNIEALAPPRDDEFPLLEEV